MENSKLHAEKPTDLEEQKKDAEEFLSEQIRKLDKDQKKTLSWVLFGATMGSNIVGPKTTAQG